MQSINNQESLFSLFLSLWRHFSRERQRQFFLLVGLMLVSAFAEVLSLGAVLPFIGVLLAPESVLSAPFISSLAQIWGIHSAEQLILPFTLAFVFLALAGGVIRMFVIWACTRLAHAGGADIGIEIYRRTLYQPFQVHVARNSSAIVSAMTTKVNRIVYDLLLPMLVLGSSIVLILAITATLIVINPFVALVVTGGFGFCYALISFLTRSRLRYNSLRVASEENKVVKALHEGLGGIRDVLLDGAQSVYCNIYRSAELGLCRAKANISFISSCPRYIMEAIGMVLIALLAYSLSLQSGGVAEALPVLAALALGAQRLLPAIQQGYNSWATIASCEVSLIEILALLEQPLPERDFSEPVKSMPFKNSIRFDSVDFRYSSSGPLIIEGLNLAILRGSRVGFVGITGSGKSTTLDLLMGLLVPTKGRVIVDDQPIIGSKIVEWQKNIAHVPQSIYLSDATISENIAFGVPPKFINIERVKLAARQAHIAEFIEAGPYGYNALVGERGIRLSGGQRQRIGIARALYKQASVLVFDEATSALDNTTEQSVMSAIDSLSSNLTILIIAHRITTLKSCDVIFELERGRIIAQGTYADLLESSIGFSRIASLDPVRSK
jgi:ABC-type multidrug transport system fused ATPase/permease subunit